MELANPVLCKNKTCMMIHFPQILHGFTFTMNVYGQNPTAVEEVTLHDLESLKCAACKVTRPVRFTGKMYRGFVQASAMACTAYIQ